MTVQGDEMREVTEAALEALNVRHAQFGDALIRRVTLTFNATPQWRQVNVEIEAKDSHSADGWGTAHFEFRGVQRLHLLEDRTTNVVLDGIDWTMTERGWTADFSPVHPEGILSTFLIEAHEVWYEVT
ncbi:hypothetical protein [Deinococcus daejeonensis]|uniref:Uncharacterized protein n=1 Tax=Deinococcus daejeonensis TaxID=1007098 RepID=A0ABQ2ITQ7_9DEIO|nr:hypothetical protein [Deinococcus daejeonensis]GGN30365.1 hypothetical protein GCM10010842_05590 [Deinococcus daejeonensis]